MPKDDKVGPKPNQVPLMGHSESCGGQGGARHTILFYAPTICC
jgi:hypothetical protein